MCVCVWGGGGSRERGEWYWASIKNILTNDTNDRFYNVIGNIILLLAGHIW